AALHFASAVNTPTVAIFGITDPILYGPVAEKSRVVASKRDCVPCKKPSCIYLHNDCMKDISVDEVFSVLKEVLS
ncbi:MAG: glycosyltransferase family 9 protein, partial [Candidatus Omnitrophica bacterium]|nr:glycosyltransferase family 9 protein [Candidatus Omnitrophota bacterium]